MSVQDAMKKRTRDAREVAVVDYWRRRGLSSSTIQVYQGWIRRFQDHCKQRKLDEIEQLCLAGMRRFAHFYSWPRVNGKPGPILPMRCGVRFTLGMCLEVVGACLCRGGEPARCNSSAHATERICQLPASTQRRRRKHPCEGPRHSEAVSQAPAAAASQPHLSWLVAI